MFGQVWAYRSCTSGLLSWCTRKSSNELSSDKLSNHIKPSHTLGKKAASSNRSHEVAARASYPLHPFTQFLLKAGTTAMILHSVQKFWAGFKPVLAIANQAISLSLERAKVGRHICEEIVRFILLPHQFLRSTPFHPDQGVNVQMSGAGHFSWVTKTSRGPYVSGAPNVVSSEGSPETMEAPHDVVPWRISHFT